MPNIDSTKIVSKENVKLNYDRWVILLKLSIYHNSISQSHFVCVFKDFSYLLYKLTVKDFVTETYQISDHIKYTLISYWSICYKQLRLYIKILVYSIYIT